ncbi:MAG: YgaP-like transmembrane domain [Planctomycetaceae bacterium]
MQCNIDKRGRALRTTMGAVTSLVGVGLLAARYVFDIGDVPQWAGIAALAGGAFMIFEGVNGWCVVRAMGFKTPI